MKRLTVENTKKAVSRVAAPIKEIEKKVNPLEQKVNTHETVDSGTESLKLANQTIKTTNKAIKTTKKSVKTTKNIVKKTPRTIKKTAKIAVKVTKATVKVVEVTVKVTAKAITEIAAALSNPYVLLAVAIIVVVVFIIYSFVILLGGGDTNQTAMTQAIGLVNVEEQYDNGKDFYNTALENHENELSDIMNSLDYDKDNREESDLLYYKRFEPTQIIYEKDFPTDARKQNIMNTWEHQFDDSEVVDFMAIAYVYLEKKKNDEQNTNLKIYEVEFTQEVFDELIEICIPFSDTVNQNQECPNVDCTRDKEAYKEWQKSDELLNKSIDGYNEWVEEIQPYIDENGYDAEWVEWRVNGNWYSVYGEIFPNEPICDSSEAAEEYRKYCGDIYNELETKTKELEEIYEASTACYHKHELHSLGVSFFDEEQLMDALDFDETEKQWAELTSYGFEEMGVDDED